jgi:hypothetical protein
VVALVLVALACSCSHRLRICYGLRLAPAPLALHLWRERARKWGLLATGAEQANNHRHRNHELQPLGRSQHAATGAGVLADRLANG